MQWSEEGIASAHKFIQKLWNLNTKITNEINKDHKQDTEDKISKFTNQFIKKVTDSLNNFSYNVIIANLHELYSFLFNEINEKYTKKTLLLNYEKILIVMMPIIPHLSNECLKLLNINKNISWPRYDKKFLVEQYVNIVVQINGKKRGLLKSERNTKQEEVEEMIKKEKNISKYLTNQKIKKKIFIPNKLINIII